jgi:hypothetical protein
VTYNLEVRLVNAEQAEMLQGLEAHNLSFRTDFAHQRLAGINFSLQVMDVLCETLPIIPDHNLRNTCDLQS